jgi:catechol 2,3-dioxygenase-like lactoylglutathione lyase family enzyme
MKKRRPSVAVGHVILHVSDVTASERFYRVLGLRPIESRSFMAILEMRGGTHLMLFKSKEKPASGTAPPFDLMVDHVKTFRASLGKAGVRRTPLRHDRISGHDAFRISDPDGHVLNVYSSHTGGRPV